MLGHDVDKRFISQLYVQFSMQRLRDMFRLAVLGGAGIIFVMISIVTLVGVTLGRPLPETLVKEE